MASRWEAQAPQLSRKETMRLYHAICSWIEASAFEKLTSGVGEEPQPEGNNFAQTEHAHSFSSEPELHAGWRPSDLQWEDRAHISLRWQPPGR